jgi:hypothetical protein
MIRESTRIFDVACNVDIEQTAASLHAHAILQDVQIHPGDTVLVHGAPSRIGYGEHLCIQCLATVVRAGPLRRWWTQVTGLLDLVDLFEVGFQSRERS